jgi:hypothetical protein
MKEFLCHKEHKGLKEFFLLYALYVFFVAII